MNTDLRERVARAIAGIVCKGVEIDAAWPQYLPEADAVLSELGLTQAEPVAWGKRDKQGGIWECVDSRELAYPNGTPEYNIPLYAAPLSPQASAEELLREALAGLEAHTGEATRQTQERIRASLGVGK